MRANIIYEKTINNEKTYHGWPTICRLKNGELLVVASGGRKMHVCPYGKIYMYRSKDEGRSWDGPIVLYAGPLDNRDAGILETSKGTLIVNFFTNLAWMDYLYRAEFGKITWLEKSVQDEWRIVRQKLVDDGINVVEELGDWVMRSEDGGKTWSDKEPSFVNSPHGPVELSDGRLLYVGNKTVPNYERDRGSSHEPGIKAAAESRDDGKTWRIIGEIPIDEANHQNYCELHQVETKSGRVIAHARHSSGEIFQTESDDGGFTWSKPHRTGIIGLPPHLIRLKKNWLLCSYGYRKEPYGIRASISKDEGITWSDPIVICDDCDDSDLGYPSSLEMDDGSIITLWYQKPKASPIAFLRLARWQAVGSF